jgi:hypothetical protein
LLTVALKYVKVIKFAELSEFVLILAYYCQIDTVPEAARSKA